MADPIRAGFVTPGAAKAISRASSEAQRSESDIAQLPQPPREEYPALLTSMNVSTLAFAWSEQDYDSNGQRKLKTPGMSGTTTWNPAFPVGDGVLPPAAFPVETVVVRRCLRSGGDFAFEFPWSCTCGGGGSGSGSGGGTFTPCCPGKGIPDTLFATCTVTTGSCPAIDGQVITLTPLGTYLWGGSLTTAGGHTWFVTLQCVGGGWVLHFTTDGGAPSESAMEWTCTTFSVTRSFIFPGGACPGAEILVTVTE